MGHMSETLNANCHRLGVTNVTFIILDKLQVWIFCFTQYTSIRNCSHIVHQQQELFTQVHQHQLFVTHSTITSSNDLGHRQVNMTGTVWIVICLHRHIIVWCQRSTSQSELLSEYIHRHYVRYRFPEIGPRTLDWVSKHILDKQQLTQSQEYVEIVSQFIWLAGYFNFINFKTERKQNIG